MANGNHVMGLLPLDSTGITECAPPARPSTKFQDLISNFERAIKKTKQEQNKSGNRQSIKQNYNHDSRKKF